MKKATKKSVAQTAQTPIEAALLEAVMQDVMTEDQFEALKICLRWSNESLSTYLHGWIMGSVQADKDDMQMNAEGDRNYDPALARRLYKKLCLIYDRMGLDMQGRPIVA